VTEITLFEGILRNCRSSAPTLSHAAMKGTGMRVLLIEDDSATAQSIELMLKSESFNVYRRISARKASTSVKSTTTTSSFSI
jgi:PleD family two-component response regulator